MSSRTLPDPDQAVLGGILAVRNADDLYQAAGSAAGIGKFGCAVALAVLSLEEAAKGRALLGWALAKRHGLPFRLSDAEFETLLYRGHALRHVVAFEQGMSNVTATAWITGAIPAVGAEREQLEADLRVAEWLQGANQLKQRGLYVDFVAPEWANPATIGRNEWSDTREVVEPFLAEARRQADTCRTMVPTREPPPTA